MALRRSTIVAVTAILLGAGVASFALYRVVRANSHVSMQAKAPVASLAAVPSAQPASGTDKAPSLYFVKDPESVPPFLVRDLAGQAVSTAALKGKVVILNFWATWCGPCREEIPDLIALQAQYKNQLQIIGISEDEAPPAQVAQFVKKVGINYPVVMSSEALEREYGGIAALPTSFFVNPQGQVVAKDVGVYPPEYYDLQVRALAGLPVNAHIETFKDTGQIFLKNAANATELPGVSFAGLTPAQKKIALHRLNTETCTCGCGMTIAQCRITDPTCPTSKELAMKIVRSITGSGPSGPVPASKSGATR